MGSQPVGISASRGAAILGLSEYQTQFEVWQQLMEEREPGFNASRGYVLPPPPDSAPLRWGTAFEDAVVELAQEATGRRIVLREYLYSAPGLDYVTCHIDGAYNEPDAAKRIQGPATRRDTLHEGKTTFERAYYAKWGEPGTDRVPQTYQVQGQHQMGCTGAELNIISVLVFPKAPDEWEKDGYIVVQYENPIGKYWMIAHLGKDGRIDREIAPGAWGAALAQMGFFHQYPIAADPTAQKLLFEGYAHFWAHHVLEAVEPEISDYDDIRRAFPEPVGTIVCDDELERLIKEYDAIGEEIGDKGPLKKRREQLKILILQRARIADKAIDDESRDKTIFVSADGGNKLASYNGKSFR